jgi:hypothetical protein
MNRALGEMAHTRDQTRWFEARGMLTELQPAGVEADPQTARGFCLTALVMLTAQEVIDTAGAVSTKIAACLDEVFEWRHPEDAADERSVDELLAPGVGPAQRCEGLAGSRSFWGRCTPSEPYAGGTSAR